MSEEKNDKEISQGKVLAFREYQFGGSTEPSEGDEAPDIPLPLPEITTKINYDEWKQSVFEPKYHNFCTMLDSIIIRKLELIQEYLDVTAMMRNQVSDGFIQIAKSRYIMGPNSVSRSNLPNADCEDFTAMVTITNRIVKKSDIMLPHYIINSHGEKKQQTKLINRFGILTTQSLKVAQKRFSSGIQLAVDLLNAITELNANQVQFDNVSEHKNRLLLLEKFISGKFESATQS